MEIVLYLMNYKGRAFLKALHNNFASSVSFVVVCSRDSNVQNDSYQDIINYCHSNDITCYDRKDEFKPEKASYKFAVGWRWLIKDDANLIVFHDSLLPKYRGFAPLVNSLINKEKEIGVTAFFASDKMDEGDILAQKSRTVNYPIKIADAIVQVSKLYQEAGIEVINDIVNNSLKIKKQVHSNATYSVWRDEEDYKIDWTKSAEYIERFVNALGEPFLGAYTLLDDKKVRIKSLEVFPSVELELVHVGKVLFLDKGKPVVITGSGLVKLLEATDSDGNDILPLNNFRTRFK